MDYRANITPGIIESYCLGLLEPKESKMVEQQARIHADIKQEIDDFMLLLENYIISNALHPEEDVKVKTLGLLDNLRLEEAKNIHQLPMINKYTDHNNWLQMVEPLLPEKLQGEVFVHELRNDSKVSQLLIWSAVNVPDEVHDDVRESFIVLKGRCRCYIEDTVAELGPGGFLEIPMHKHHDVRVIEEPVLAIVQRIKVA